MRRIVYDGSMWRTLDISPFYWDIPLLELMHLIEHASPYVQNLNLRGCTQLKASAHLQVRNLVNASFEGCRFFTSSSLRSLISRNPKLRLLDISGLTAVGEAVLNQLSTTCRNLEMLNINWCKNVTTAPLNDMIRALPKLTDLRLAGCIVDDNTFVAVNGLRNLTRLSLSGCPGLTDEGMKILLQGKSDESSSISPVLTNNLIHLDISRCVGLTGDAIQNLVGTSPNLQKLELAGFINLKDEDLLALLPTIPKITHIDLEDCPGITSTSLVALASCTKLRHVQVSYCSGIDDGGVLAMIEHLQLTHLDLDNTPITNAVLSALTGLRQPTKVSIYDCPNISWTGILSILTSNSDQPSTLKKIKTFYGWQRIVDTHTKRVSCGEIAEAREIERSWASWMMGDTEETLRTGNVSSRDRFLSLDEDGLRIRERRRKRGACLIM